jgi:TolC family type I secretion outer membrane protein
MSRLAALSACSAAAACANPFWDEGRDGVGLTPPAASQNAPASDVPYTTNLAAALRGLTAVDPRLAADAARQEGVVAAVSTARARFLPDVTISGGYAHADLRNSQTPTRVRKDDQDEWDSLVELRQPIYQGGELLAGLREQRARLEAGAAEQDAVRQGVFQDAAEAYVGVLRDERVAALRAENLKIVQDVRKAAQARFDAGAATRTDVALAEAQSAFSQAELERATGERAASAARYVRAFGAAPGALSEPGAIDERLPATLEAAMAAAGRSNPRALSSQAASRAAGFAARAAGASYLPKLDLRLSHADREDDFQPSQREEEQRLTVRLSVPLVNAPSWSQAREARAEARRARYQAEDAFRSAQEEAAVAWARHEAEKRRLVALNERVGAAERAAAGVRREYLGGTRTMQDLLSAEEQVVQARIDRERAQADRTSAAFALLAAVGGLEPDTVR